MKELKIEGVSKRFGKKQALKGIYLEMEAGMFGLIGHNGAGKTTLMKIISTLQKPDTGKIYLNGKETFRNIPYVKEHLGFLPQDFNFYPQITVGETLDYLCRLNGFKDKKLRCMKVDSLLESVNLKEAEHARVGGLSGGMKRRLGIATAVLKDPDVLIVDEPTAGLDPEERVRFRTMLVELSQDKIVILSTHIVEDISASCNRMALLDQGQLIYTGAPSTWLESVKDKVWEVHIRDAKELLRVKDTYSVVSIKETPTGKHIRCLADSIESSLRFKMVEPSLEDAYLYHYM